MRPLPRRLVLLFALSLPLGCGGAPASEPQVAAAAPASAVSPAKPPVDTAPRAADVAAPPESTEGPPPPPPLDLTGMPAASAAIQDVPLSASDLGELLLASIASGNIHLPPALAALKADPKKRARLIETLGPLLPSIVSSPAFRAAYAHRRAGEIAVDDVPKPAPPRSASAIQAERIAALQKAIADAEVGSQESLPPAMRDALAQALKQQRKMLDEAKKSTADSENAAAMDRQRFELEQAEYPQRVKARDEEIAKRKLAWPEDVNALVATRLDAFLELASAIDHGAKLVARGPKKVFADPALEAKPPVWKLAFRAGKPTLDAARAVAQKWRKELTAKR